MPSSLTKPSFDPETPSQWPEAISKAEFDVLFPEETDRVEFKEGLNIEDDIVAFSNARGGVILVGVRNNGEIVGCSCTQALQDKINSTRRHLHNPGPVNARPLRVDKREITVIGVTALRAGFAQTGNGRVLVRVGSQRNALLGADLAAFIQSRATKSFEDVALDVDVSGASPELRWELATVLGAPDISTADDCLVEWGFAERDDGRCKLTVVGALYLLERPDVYLGKAYIEILRFQAGADNPDKRVEVVGPLNRQVEDATRFVADELGSDEVVLGLRRHNLPRLPERVLREAIANAVAHRSYELRGTAVRVEVHPDRVEVVSPGGLLPPVTIERMRDQQAARNSKALRVLRAFNLAEDRGKGVDLIQDLMRNELLAQPEFSATDSSVSVVLPVLSGTSPEERAWVREVETRGQIEERDRALLVHARRGEVLTNQRARELLKASRDVATAALKRLTDAGLLERIGERGGTRYRLAGDLTPPAGLRLDRSEIGEIVLSLAEDGPVTNARVRTVTGLDRQDALSVLDELVAKGALVRVGQKRGTRYLLASSSTTARRA